MMMTQQKVYLQAVSIGEWAKTACSAHLFEPPCLYYMDQSRDSKGNRENQVPLPARIESVMGIASIRRDMAELARDGSRAYRGD